MARAALMDALDELDGSDDGRFDKDALRARIAAEIGRGKARAGDNPERVIWIAVALALVGGVAVALVVCKALG